MQTDGMTVIVLRQTDSFGAWILAMHGTYLALIVNSLIARQLLHLDS